MANANLSRPFIIEFNGQFVLNSPWNTDIDNEGRVQASVGDRRDAAVFKLDDGILHKADGNGPMRFLGRFIVESLVPMPEPVYWVPEHEQVKRWSFTGDESSPHTLECEGIFGRCYI